MVSELADEIERLQMAYEKADATLMDLQHKTSGPSAELNAAADAFVHIFAKLQDALTDNASMLVQALRDAATHRERAERLEEKLRRYHDKLSALLTSLLHLQKDIPSGDLHRIGFLIQNLCTNMILAERLLIEDGTDMRRQVYRGTPSGAVREAASLLESLQVNDPDDSVADGVTALDVWRKTAERVLPCLKSMV